MAENFTSVDEWQTMDGLEAVEAENAEEAAKWAACTDGLENALFRVYELIPDEFGGMEKSFPCRRLSQKEKRTFPFKGTSSFPT